MPLDVSELASDLVAAASQSLGSSWKNARNIAEPQLRDLARIAADIGRQTAEGAISKQEAKALYAIHLNTAKIILLTIEGLGILAAEAAINAVLVVLRDTANTALGFELV
jgi:hypothetical protein